MPEEAEGAVALQLARSVQSPPSRAGRPACFAVAADLHLAWLLEDGMRWVREEALPARKDLAAVQADDTQAVEILGIVVWEGHCARTHCLCLVQALGAGENRVVAGLAGAAARPSGWN